MKTAELRELSVEELSGKLYDFREELFKLRFNHATAQLENTQRIGIVKKIIARILTILGEKKRGAQEHAKSEKV